MKKIIAALLLTTSQLAFAGGGITDDACKLYVCLMGSSQADGGTDCVTRIQEFVNNDMTQCPASLPTCIGTSGPVTSGVLMYSNGSLQGPENGQILLACVNISSFPPICENTLASPSGTYIGVGGGGC